VQRLRRWRVEGAQQLGDALLLVLDMGVSVMVFLY
jgi:hypothetical protein